MKPNRRKGGGDLADDRETLGQFVEMAAESSEYPLWKEATATEEVVLAAQEFDHATYLALEALLEAHRPDDGVTADELWNDEHAAYLILMTLRGEGVGIWDGDWDRHWEATRGEPGRQQAFWEEAELFLTPRTRAAFQALETAFHNAAYETSAFGMLPYCLEVDGERCTGDEFFRDGGELTPSDMRTVADLEIGDEVLVESEDGDFQIKRVDCPAGRNGLRKNATRVPPPLLPSGRHVQARRVSALRRAREMTQASKRDRFEPTKPPTWRGSSRDVVVNRGRGK